MAEPFLLSIKKYSRENPVISKKIEMALKLSGPEVRALVRYLRRNGYAIGSNSKGYYWIKDVSELEITIRHLQERKCSIEKTINEMQSISFGNYQYKLL